MSKSNCKAFGAVCLLSFALAALPAVRGRPNESSHSYKDVDINKSTTLECPVFNEVMEMNETYAFVKWKIWIDNGIYPFWKWFAGLNQAGEIKAPKGFNISKVDGSLMIDRARPCDARKFMCIVERKNGKSPKDHCVTLRLREENGNQTQTPAQRRKDKPGDCECKKEPAPQNDNTTLKIVIGVLSALLFVTLAFIVFQNRSFLRERVFSRYTPPTGAQSPEGGVALGNVEQLER